MPSITAILDQCPFEAPFKLRERLSPIEDKVDQFVRRFWKDLVVFGTIALVTFSAGLYSQSLGRAAQAASNLFWTLGNSNGTPILEDYLIPWNPDQELILPIPDDDAFRDRLDSIDRMATRLSRPVTATGNTTQRNCWLSGPPGIGKSSAVRVMADRLKRQGHDVYRVTSAAYRTPGAMNRINEDMRGIEPVPVLILDEGEDALASWREFNEGVPQFNLLVVSNGTGAHPGMQSRFGGEHSGGHFHWEPWSKEQVAAILRPRFNVAPELLLALVEVCENVDGGRVVEEIPDGLDAIEHVVPPPDLLRLCEGHLEQHQRGEELWQLLRVDQKIWEEKVEELKRTLDLQEIQLALSRQYPDIGEAQVRALCHLFAEGKGRDFAVGDIRGDCETILQQWTNREPWEHLGIEKVQWEEVVTLYQRVV